MAKCSYYNYGELVLCFRGLLSPLDPLEPTRTNGEFRGPTTCRLGL